MAHKLIHFNLDHAIKLYESGKSLAQVADEIGICSYATIGRRMIKAGIKLRTMERVASLRLTKRMEDVIARGVGRYLAGETINDLCAELGVGRRLFQKAVITAGYELRTQAKSLGLRYNRMSLSERAAITTAANAAMRGKPASAGRMAQRAATNERTLQLASRADLILSVWLAQRGIQFTAQKALGPYNIDIAIDELSVAVEVNGGWHYFEGRAVPEAQRREYLFNRGWRLIEVKLTAPELKVWKWLRPACADKVVALLNELRQGEPAWGKHCVLGGDGEVLS
jgi:very-short-patch-repair endonuclease